MAKKKKKIAKRKAARPGAAKKASKPAIKKTKRTSGKKASTAKGKAAPRKKTAAKKATAKKATAGKKKGAARKTAASLGRPKVTGDEKLYLLFRDDYHARQIFEFLRVETVRDLEQFGPQEIIDRLSHPIRQTVDRIRTLLADKNRALKDDRPFALARKSTH